MYNFTRRKILTSCAAAAISGTLAGCSDLSVEAVPGNLTAAAVPDLKTTNGFAVNGFTANDLAGRKSLIVGFASWCPYCRKQHDRLMALRRTIYAPIFGIVVSDSATNTAQFLNKAGNPFTAVGYDPKGEITVSLGQTGLPFTLVVDQQLNIAAAYPGELTAEHVDPIVNLLKTA